MYNIFDHMDERTLERMQPEDYDRLVKLQGTAAELLEALKVLLNAYINATEVEDPADDSYCVDAQYAIRKAQP